MNDLKAKQYWNDFHKTLDKIGVHAGDILYIASDIARILTQARTELEFASRAEQYDYIDALIDALKEHVTEEGTLLFPVYSWAFCKGAEFDMRKTQGEVGALNNYVLNKRADFVRTRHPLYSFMVWGKDAAYLAQMNNQDSWGELSPFKYLHENGAKELDLSVTLQRSLTFKHYVEQCVQVPYRHFKYFLSDYVDEQGKRETRCYSMYVRDLSVSLHSVQEIAFFIEAGCARKTVFRQWDISVLEFDKAFEVMKEDLLHNNGAHLYEFTDYKIDWNKQDAVYEIGYLRDKTLL